MDDSHDMADKLLRLAFVDMVGGHGSLATEQYDEAAIGHEQRPKVVAMTSDSSSLLFWLKNLNTDAGNALIFLVTGIGGNADADGANIAWTKFGLPVARALNPANIPPTATMVRMMCKALDFFHSMRLMSEWEGDDDLGIKLARAITNDNERLDIQYHIIDMLDSPDDMEDIELSGMYFARSYDIEKNIELYAADQLHRFFSKTKCKNDKRVFATSRRMIVQYVTMSLTHLGKWRHDFPIVPPEMIEYIMSFLKHTNEPGEGSATFLEYVTGATVEVAYPPSDYNNDTGTIANYASSTGMYDINVSDVTLCLQQHQIMLIPSEKDEDFFRQQNNTVA